jgi:LEA14-like dessication related protein
MKTGEKVFIYSAFAALIGLLSFAAYSVNKNVNLLKNATIKLLDVKLDTKSSKKWVIGFLFSFENKSNIDIEITGYSCDLRVNNILVGKAISSTSQYVLAHTESQLIITAAFDPSLIWKGLLNTGFIQTLIDYKNIGASISGVVSAKHSSFAIQNIPIQHEVKVSDYLDKTPAV